MLNATEDRMSESNRPTHVLEDLRVKATRETRSKRGSSRRAFLSQVGGAAATIAAGATIAQTAVAATNGSGQQEFGGSRGPGSAESAASGRSRAQQSFNNRVQAAQAELSIRIPNEVTNGYEQRFPNHIGNYSKGLAHKGIGEVLPSSYARLLRAVNTGNPSAFNQIQMGGSVPLVDPQCGLAFDLEGTDSHQLAIGTPPSVASQQMADTAVENYWMALCRDINFTQYGQEPLTQVAIAELNSLPGS